MSDNTPPIKNILITSKILMFLNALDSKKKINPEIGTNSAPINIIPGMALALPNIFVNIHNAKKVIPKAKNTRENTREHPRSSPLLGNFINMWRRTLCSSNKYIIRFIFGVRFKHLRKHVTQI